MIYIRVSVEESVECSSVVCIGMSMSVRLSRKKLNERSNLESLWSRTKGKVRHGHDITGRINHPSGRPVAFKLLSAVLDALSRPVLFSPSILFLSQSLTDWRLTDRRLLKLVSHERFLRNLMFISSQVQIYARKFYIMFNCYDNKRIISSFKMITVWSMFNFPYLYMINCLRRIVLCVRFHLNTICIKICFKNIFFVIIVFFKFKWRNL